MPYKQPAVRLYSKHIADSFARITGKKLLPDDSAEALYRAPFVLVSHGMQNDPVFNYANLTAQGLWKMDWDTFTSTASRLSAPPEERSERQQLLDRTHKERYIDDYKGVRITADRRLFAINECILWNVLDENDTMIGQAATFAKWEFL